MKHLTLTHAGIRLVTIQCMLRIHFHLWQCFKAVWSCWIACVNYPALPTCQRQCSSIWIQHRVSYYGATSSIADIHFDVVENKVSQMASIFSPSLPPLLCCIPLISSSSMFPFSRWAVVREERKPVKTSLKPQKWFSGRPGLKNNNTLVLQVQHESKQNHFLR